MIVSVSKGIWAMGILAVVAVWAGPASAAVLPTGACCNFFTGSCCEPDGFCSETTMEECSGLGVTYKGDGTTCEGECAATTTTTSTSTSTTTTTTTSSSTSTSTSTSSTTLPPVAICGDANGDLQITSTDALIALRTAVGTSSCGVERCDYNGSGEVTSPDALLILRVAVGQIVVPMCPVVI